MSTDVIKNNCDRWIEYAYGVWLVWLRHAKPDQYYLRESTQILVNRMRNAVVERSNEEAWNLLERLKKLGTSIHGMRNDFGGDGFLYEQAEINLECAVVAYQIGDNQEAGALLDVTSGSFGGRSVHKAVTCWIAGCIQWQSQSHFDTALVNWEKSCRIMTELAGNNTFDAIFADECSEIARVMRGAIREASILGFPPPSPGAPGAHPSTGTQPGQTPPPNPGPRNPSGNPGYPSARLRTFPVIGSIPAGSPIGIVDDSGDEAMVDGFDINGYYYKLYSLVGGFDINANQNTRYFILKVNGTSMNNALPVKIENGDYILMVKQDTAESGDIVAAEIGGEDREATLKRYSYVNNEYKLSPESLDLANIHLTYHKDFYIRGKAIAVLKRDG